MLIRLDNAFRSFFRRCRSVQAPGFPRFRPLQRMQCIDVVQVSGGMVRRRKKGYVLRIKRSPHMRLHPSRGLPEGEALRAVRIVRKPQGVRVSLCHAVEKQALEPSAETVGIDLGVRSRMTLSDGTVWPAARLDWQSTRRRTRDGLRLLPPRIGRNAAHALHRVSPRPQHRAVPGHLDDPSRPVQDGERLGR